MAPSRRLVQGFAISPEWSPRGLDPAPRRYELVWRSLLPDARPPRRERVEPRHAHRRRDVAERRPAHARRPTVVTATGRASSRSTSSEARSSGSRTVVASQGQGTRQSPRNEPPRHSPGLGGDDRIAGRGGNDDLFGGPGDDSLLARDGQHRSPRLRARPRQRRGRPDRPSVTKLRASAGVANKALGISAHGVIVLRRGCRSEATPSADRCGRGSEGAAVSGCLCSASASASPASPRSSSTRPTVTTGRCSSSGWALIALGAFFVSISGRFPRFERADLLPFRRARPPLRPSLPGEPLRLAGSGDDGRADDHGRLRTTRDPGDPFGVSNYQNRPASLFVVWGKLGLLLGGIDLFHVRLLHALFALLDDCRVVRLVRQLLPRRWAFFAGCLLGAQPLAPDQPPGHA